MPLGLLLLAPIVVQIGLFHTLLAPAGAPMALFLVGMLAYLGWAYRGAFRTVLAPRMRPTQGRQSFAAPRPAAS